ncbi:MAG TPA: hypothetical protein VG457_01200, partial [Planctomycetota bacterium]|nr:hypothetical protein [Planctomycetota bacterium]
GRDRVDLGLPPGLAPLSPPERTSVGFSAQGDLRMICGQFDLKASLQHLLGREARQEFLDGILQALVGEVVGSGMELLCQAEPTLCTLIQNYSVSANLKVGYYKDLCTAAENALVDAGRKAGAAAMDRCLKEKKDQGLSLDRAIEACHHELPQIRGFHGEALAELDFGKELGAVFQQMGLSPGAEKLAGRLSDQAVVGPGSSSAQADPRALPQFFDEKRQTYADRLGGLLDQAAHRQAVASVDLRQAVPDGAPPLAPDEIQQLSLLSPEDRAAAVGSISSALAIFEMGAQIAEVERALEILKGVPTVDPAKRELLEDRLARLRSEKLRLVERMKDQALVQEAYASARRLSSRQYSNRVAAVQSRAGQAERDADLLRDTAPLGALPQTTKSALPGSGASRTASASCDSCGVLGSFGSYAARKP